MITMPKEIIFERFNLNTAFLSSGVGWAGNFTSRSVKSLEKIQASFSSVLAKGSLYTNALTAIATIPSCRAFSLQTANDTSTYAATRILLDGGSAGWTEELEISQSESCYLVFFSENIAIQADLISLSGGYCGIRWAAFSDAWLSTT